MLEKLFDTDAIKPQNSVPPWNFPQKALTSHPHISFGKNLSYPTPILDFQLCAFMLSSNLFL
jgi:hypothetical protein